MTSIDNDIFVKVRFLYPSLSKSEKAVADILLDEGENVTNYTMAEYAEKAGCSDASILRFCRRLGVEGFADLKQQLADVTTYTYDHGAYRISKEDDLRTIFQKIIWYYERTLKDTLTLYNDDYDKALEAMRNAKAIHFFGVGDAHLVCEAAQMKFARIGINCTAYSDTALMLATASLLGEDDVVVGISFSGDTRVVVDATRIARENGAKTICIVHFEKSKLAKYADIKLFTATTDMTAGHDEIARRAAEHAIVETLYMGMITRDAEKYKPRIKKTISAIIANK
ncbi:MAG: putative HTH-type transcriptional regulator YbbH [Desulfovibrio sp.]|uniref:MurR/RpiR family transcriptional regulator n=1 Tax=Christensenella intestinihominis TaxID=1851429 RepID=UPI00082BEEE6|nr:MurR/RpiR family transcriptional regulator [Christensenella intestinihominis]